MIKNKLSAAIAFAIAATPVVLVPNASANERVGGLEEVIVTARKREESLQDAPLTMQALSEQRIEKFEVTSLERIQQVTPQLYVGRVSNGSGAQITMRGIGASSATSIGIEQSVSVILNGAYYGQGRVLNEGMFDLAQIEILKGPQSLFFGKNATAGVISLTTAKPTEEWETTVRAAYEFETEQTRLEGIVSGPLSDTVGMRLAVRDSQMDGGWYKNNAAAKNYYYLEPGFGVAFVEEVPADNRKMPQEDETLARLTLSIDPTDDLSILLTGQMSEVSVLNSAYNHVPFSCDGPTSAWGIDCSGESFNIAHNPLPESLGANLPYAKGSDLYNDYESWSFNAEVNYSMGDFNLTSITNFQSNTNDWALPGDFANADSGIFATEHSTWDAWSQEFRLASDFDGNLNYMVGLLYQETQRDFNQWVTFGFASYNADAPAGLEYVTYNKTSWTDGDTISPFFEIQYQLSETVEVTAGARYTKETKKSEFQQPYLHPNATLAGLTWEAGGTTGDQTFKEWSPEATISWQMSDEINLYAAYKTAYKSGGFSNGAVWAGDLSPPETFMFEPETASGFEVGMKSMLLDNQLRLNGSIYSYEVKDLQLDYFNSADIVFITINAGKATSEGMELDMEYAPNSMPGLSVRGTLAYNKAEYKDFIAPCWDGQLAATDLKIECDSELPGYPGSPGQNISGQATGMAPEMSASFGVSYDGEMANGMGWGVGFDGLYSDDYNASALGHPYAWRDSYVMYNAMAYIAGQEDKWEVKLLGKNLGNELVISGALEGANSGAVAGRSQADLIGYGGPGRTVELQATVRF